MMKPHNYNKNTPLSIQAMFNSIAANYDRANAILSWGMHRSWNRELVKQVGPSSKLLDLCAGTGDIAYAYLKKNPQAEAHLLDFSSEMLARAEQKRKKGQQVQFIKGDAMALPLPDNSYPCTTMAYGIRNIQNPLKSLEEIHRVLRPQGVVAILELTRPENRWIRKGHSLYLQHLLPKIGRLITSNQEAYNYLCSSIESFIPPEHLLQLLQEAGFREITLKPLTLGTATIFRAIK